MKIIKIEIKHKIELLIIICIAILLAWPIVYRASLPPPEPWNRFITGALDYQPSFSQPLSGNVTFMIILGTPSFIEMTDMRINILDNENQMISNFTSNWTHYAVDRLHIGSRDRLTVIIQGEDISGFEIIISVRGYHGTISGQVPNAYRGN